MAEPSTPKRTWSRKKTTSKRVIIADRLSQIIITGGGIGTIIAVLGVCLFLFWVAFPLFQTAGISNAATHPAPWSSGSPLAFGIDEYQVLGWTLLPTGTLEAFEVGSGEVVYRKSVAEEKTLTCVSTLIGSDEVVFGFDDGTVQTATIKFDTAFLKNDAVPEPVKKALNDLPVGSAVRLGEGAVQVTPEGQYRRQQLTIKLGSMTRIAEDPVRRIVHMFNARGQIICALTGRDDQVAVKAVQLTEKVSFLTGETTLEFQTPVDLPFEALSPEPPEHLALSMAGRDLYLAWDDGSIIRINCSDTGKAFIAEKGRLFEDDAELTRLAFAIGYQTLVWGDSKGRVGGGFLVRLDDFPGPSGFFEVQRNTRDSTFGLCITKHIGEEQAAVTSLGSSSRSRILAVGYADGRVRLFNITSEGLVASLRTTGDSSVTGVVISPKEDGLLAIAGNRIFHCELDPKYPEANFNALFRPIWYEGYARAQHMWQSSSASDDFEPKMGLMPLIFGTIKATFYSMLFGAPLALLAAIFSSEFLHPRLKGGIKPTIELMASLPSVVLGFLAALVFAPFIENVVPTTLCVFLTVPLSFVGCAYLWQLLPQRVCLPLSNWRILFFLFPLILGMMLAIYLGPLMEQWLFSGDIKGWLAWEPGSDKEANRSFQSSVGGWMILWLPLSAFFTTYLVNAFFNPRLRSLSRRVDRHALALIGFFKFLFSTALVVTVAWVLSRTMNAFGWDPRGSYIETYVQRNSLVVGIVMGFAIIPIIYTIADDALSTVPDHLRGASLGAGATKWQTAVRVVIPTAMSGLFSAMMIGLGRAVGETMIVLMATGNTPILKWNIFEGFRTLSANIAVELPEAVKDSTHYRTLFLSALVLFILTFIVNTIAELVRLKFRKRATAL